MRIKGAGGCQDIRLYETDFQTAWQLIFDCMGQCGIEVQQVDNEHHVAHGRKKSMYYDITLRDMEDGTVQIYFDQHKKYIEVYSFRNDTNTMDQFFKFYETRLEEMHGGIKCPYCGSPVQANNKYCPECGKQLNCNKDVIDNSDEAPGFFEAIFKRHDS